MEANLSTKTEPVVVNAVAQRLPPPTLRSGTRTQQIIKPTITETLAAARARLGLLSPGEMAQQSVTAAQKWVVKDLIPAESINAAVGDSGLGKSPLFYQAGVCVSEGIPFLGHDTKKGLAVYVDFENGIRQIHELITRISEYLGLSGLPRNLLTWSYGATNKPNVKDMIASLRPQLLIIDSLRGYNAEAEKENSVAAKVLQGLRVLARKYGTAVLLIHHTKKPGEDGRPSLENSPIMEWLDQASGARALINQSDVRIGIDKPRPSREGVALIIKGHERVVGEFGPFYIARNSNAEGDPAGYSWMTGARLLFNPEQEKALENLPATFSFKDAKFFYGKGDSATDHFLKKSIDVGVVKKLGRGRYAKVPASMDHNGVK